jgi:hypothetical protein
LLRVLLELLLLQQRLHKLLRFRFLARLQTNEPKHAPNQTKPNQTESNFDQTESRKQKAESSSKEQTIQLMCIMRGAPRCATKQGKDIMDMGSLGFIRTHLLGILCLQMQDQALCRNKCIG